MKHLLLPLVFALCVTPTLPAQDAAEAGAKKAEPVLATDGYPLDTCLVSGEELGAKTKTVTVEGYTLKVCCSKCVGKVEKDPKPYVEKLEAAYIAAQLKNYPLKECVVSGKPLGSMGEPHKLVLDGTLVQLCCKSCVKRAQANKDQIVAKIRAAAVEQQSKSYAGKKCPASDEELEDPAKAVKVVHGNTLVLLCCEDCVKGFQKTPNAMVAKALGLPAAKQDKQGAKPEGKPEKVPVDEFGPAKKKN
ncbi:MAG: hypothetical protein IT458_13250 [Planctomycetes bacterium]|nr:hypothetical protein [Planctomycetota bacterium]